MKVEMCQWVLEVEEAKCMGKALGVGMLLNRVMSVLVEKYYFLNQNRYFFPIS